MTDVRRGDYGTTITLTVVDADAAAIDISGATSKVIVFRRHDGTRMTKAATFTDDGTDGKIYYTLVAADLAGVPVPDEPSAKVIWRAQGVVVTNSGEWTTAETSFNVMRTL